MAGMFAHLAEHRGADAHVKAFVQPPAAPFVPRQGIVPQTARIAVTGGEGQVQTVGRQTGTHVHPDGLVVGMERTAGALRLLQWCRSRFGSFIHRLRHNVFHILCRADQRQTQTHACQYSFQFHSCWVLMQRYSYITNLPTFLTHFSAFYHWFITCFDYRPSKGRFSN